MRMKTVLKWGAIACIPGGVPLAIAVWVIRRAMTKNTVTVVRVPNTPVLKVHRGGKA